MREIAMNIRNHKKSTTVEQLTATSLCEAIDEIERQRERIAELR